MNKKKYIKIINTLTQFILELLLPSSRRYNAKLTKLYNLSSDPTKSSIFQWYYFFKLIFLVRISKIRFNLFNLLNYLDSRGYIKALVCLYITLLIISLWLLNIVLIFDYNTICISPLMSKRKLKGKTLKRSSTKVKTKRKAEKIHIINTDFQTSLIFHILRVILRNVFGCTPDEEVQISKVFSKVGKIWKANGIAFTIKYMKSVRLHCTRYMVGDPLVQREELPIKVSLDGDMFPVILADFKHLFKSQRR